MPDTTQPTAEEPMTKTMQCRVSMNGLRRNLARDYSELVDMLNYSFQRGFEIDKDELEEKLLSLRQDIGIFHCVYDKEDPDFSDLSDETDKMAEIDFSEKE